MLDFNYTENLKELFHITGSLHLRLCNIQIQIVCRLVRFLTQLLIGISMHTFLQWWRTFLQISVTQCAQLRWKHTAYSDVVVICGTTIQNSRVELFTASNTGSSVYFMPDNSTKVIKYLVTARNDHTSTIRHVSQCENEFCDTFPEVLPCELK